MPKPLQYKTGSLIYCKGEEASKVYIVQSGKVSLVSTDVESGDDVRSQVQPGDFFGVRSALGRYPREENAIALEDINLTVFTVPEFEELAMSNAGIILKMLKVFSTQMRKTHAQIASLMETEKVKPEEGLFSIGEKYLKTKNFAYAQYVFSRYLHHYPRGKHVQQAERNLKTAEAGLANSAKHQKPKHEAKLKHEVKPVQEAELKINLPLESSGDSAAAKAYFDAINLMAQLKYEEAIQAFSKIIDANEMAEWTEKSSYETGHCFFMLEKFEDCIKYYTQFLSRYPDYPDSRDVMFYIGQSHEKAGHTQEALDLYKEIITLSGDKKDTARTKAVKAYKTLEKG
jgi:CRP-like cAMP-binding protein